MNFHDFYSCIKKKFDEHQEIFLDSDLLSVNIEDIYGSVFCILWQSKKITVEPFFYGDYNVYIKAPQKSLELLFIERQYLFQSYMNREMVVKGSFEDVMKFQKLLSYITKDNSLDVHEEIISEMLFKQDMIQNDLGLVMETLHLLLANSLMDMSEKFSANKVKEKQNFCKLDCGDVFEFGNWNQKSIKWVVLRKNEKSLLAISQDVIEKMPFHHENVKVSFVKSDICGWLNTNFYNSAFDVSEKGRITVQNIGKTELRVSMLNKEKAQVYSQYIKNNSKWWTRTSQNSVYTVPKMKVYIVEKFDVVKYSLMEQTNKDVGVCPVICISIIE